MSVFEKSIVDSIIIVIIVNFAFEVCVNFYSFYNIVIVTIIYYYYYYVLLSFLSTCMF